MKVVVFDFDGTLTQKKGHLWKRIWKELGYDIGSNSYYMELLNGFMGGEISYEEWCTLTLKAFQDKGLTKKKFNEIIDKISLVHGAEDLIKFLNSQGIEMHVVSGNIVSVIEKVLGENVKYITNINANEFLFSEQGEIVDIIGTKYDHKGKAEYIKELCERNGYQPSDVLFVGNSMNDEWVYQSGTRTICVNPDNAQSTNSVIWNKVIYTENLMDLAKEVF